MEISADFSEHTHTHRHTHTHTHTYIYIYIYIDIRSREDELGMILFENILKDSYKPLGVPTL